MNIDKCSTCIKRKTMYCPNSSECLDTENKLYYKNRTMILEENAELKKQLENLKIQLKVDKEQYNNLQREYEKSLEDYCRLDAINRTGQKEFIKFLKDEIKRLEEVQATSLEEIIGKDYFIKVKKEILSKYKEIIGDDTNE